jgi:predicted Zn-dependent protease
MKRLAIFVAVLAVGVAALYLSQRRHDSTPVSANAVVEIAADAQRDLSRVPMRLTRLSDDEEIAIGSQLAEQYSTGTPQLSPEELGLESYVRRIGSDVSSHARRRLPYSFHLVPNRAVINAFSLPGGPVYVGEGLLDLMNSEDELAAVLGHEVEHIDHYHCVERVQVEARLRKLRLDILGALVQIRSRYGKQAITRTRNWKQTEKACGWQCSVATHHTAQSPYSKNLPGSTTNTSFMPRARKKSFRTWRFRAWKGTSARTLSPPSALPKPIA